MCWHAHNQIALNDTVSALHHVTVKIHYEGAFRLTHSEEVSKQPAGGIERSGA